MRVAAFSPATTARLRLFFAITPLMAFFTLIAAYFAAY